MAVLPQISEAELEVMKVVWDYAPVSSSEIADRLVKTTKWGARTIQTLMKRLVIKGALTYEKQSRVFVYTPLVKREEYIGQESDAFVRRFFNGDLTAMISAYIDRHKLAETEIETLLTLLLEYLERIKE